jgi:hypothetical protein
VTQSWHSALESELRGLWDKVPLEPSVLPFHSEIRSWLGKGDPELALRVLAEELDRFGEDKKIGALAAAFGFYESLSGSVTDRMTGYGELLSPKRDYRTIRRYAEDAAAMVAARFVQPFRERDNQPIVSVVVTENKGTIAAKVKAEQVFKDEPICVRAYFQTGTSRPIVIDTYDEPVAQGELETTLSDGLMLLIVEWMGVFQPRISVSSPSPFAASVAVVTGALSVSLKEPTLGIIESP